MSQSSPNDKSRRRRTAARKSKAKDKPAGKASKSVGKSKPLAAPAIKKSPRKPAASGALLGVGLDNKDGHKRITTGEQFAIVGGSSETHDRMTETVIKTFEELKKRGKQLNQIERDELSEIIHKVTPR